MIDNSLLKNIPSEIISCEELKELRIKESPITSVNPLVSNLENLVFLTIEGCDLRRVAVKDFC
jgi:Leucine-rich repeat (LRR) protein